MPRVHHVKKARKDNPAVKAGEPYYWWKFRYGGKRYSKTYPKRSQRTQSAFLGALYDIEDSLGDEITREQAEELESDLDALMDECQGSLDNMPYQLQETSESGVLLQERIYALEEWISEIQGIDWAHTHPNEVAQIIIDANPGIS